MFPDAAGLALLIAGAALVAFLALRHLGLLVLVIGGPLPGLALTFMAGRFFFVAETWTYPALVWFFGFALSFLLADEFVVGLLDGAARGDAMRAAFKRRSRSILAIMGALPLALIALSFMLLDGLHYAGTAASALAAAASAVTVLWLAVLFPFDEEFVARTNRIREGWHRLFDGVIAVARPRWGFSVAGIMLVLLVLSVFGAQTLVVQPEFVTHRVALLSVIPLDFAAAAVFAVGDWRAIVSALVTLAVAAAVGLWALTLGGHPLDGASLVGLCLVTAVTGSPIFVAADEAGRRGHAGDDATVATSRTQMRMGPGLFFIPLSAAAALVCVMPWRGAVWPALLAVAVFGGAGPLLFRPALAVVLETVFPRRATIAARYRLD